MHPGYVSRSRVSDMLSSEGVVWSTDRVTSIALAVLPIALLSSILAARPMNVCATTSGVDYASSQHPGGDYPHTS